MLQFRAEYAPRVNRDRLQTLLARERQAFADDNPRSQQAAYEHAQPTCSAASP